MTRGLWMAWPAVVLASAAALGGSALRYLNARGSVETAFERQRSNDQQAERLAALRSAAPAWTARGRPGSGLTPCITAALAASGLPASAMSSLSPEAESAVGDSDLHARRSRAVVTLAPLTLPQLGSFLAVWREREPAWTVSSLDVSPQPQEKGGTGSAGRDLPLRVVIGLETLFVDRGGGH